MNGKALVWIFDRVPKPSSRVGLSILEGVPIPWLTELLVWPLALGTTKFGGNLYLCLSVTRIVIIDL